MDGRAGDLRRGDDVVPAGARRVPACRAGPCRETAASRRPGGGPGPEHGVLSLRESCALGSRQADFAPLGRPRSRLRLLAEDDPAIPARRRLRRRGGRDLTAERGSGRVHDGLLRRDNGTAGQLAPVQMQLAASPFQRWAAGAEPEPRRLRAESGVSGMGQYFVANAVSMTTGFLSVVIFVRVFLPGEYGQLSLVTGAIGFARS